MSDDELDAQDRHDERRKERAELSTLRAQVEELREALRELHRFRSHFNGCAVDQTDFCTCGLRQASDKTRAILERTKP